MKNISLIALTAISLTACMTAGDHRAAVNADDGSGRLTLGKAQQSLRLGLSQADVASSMGSPNIVTTDGHGDETWIYDKISTERADSSSSESAGAGVLGGGLIGSFLLGGSASGSAQHAASATQTSQKTLTVVVRFDAAKRVKDIQYNSTQF